MSVYSVDAFCAIAVVGTTLVNAGHNRCRLRTVPSFWTTNATQSNATTFDWTVTGGAMEAAATVAPAWVYGEGGLCRFRLALDTKHDVLQTTPTLSYCLKQIVPVFPNFPIPRKNPPLSPYYPGLFLVTQPPRSGIPRVDDVHFSSASCLSRQLRQHSWTGWLTGSLLGRSALALRFEGRRRRTRIGDNREMRIAMWHVGYVGLGHPAGRIYLT